MELLGIEMSFEEFDRLMCEQAKGKELVVDNGKVVAAEHKVTQEELLYEELYKLETWFEWYDNQICQYNRCVRLGIKFDKDIVELDNEAEIKRARIQELERLLSDNSK